MYGYINGIDWLNCEAMKYWSYASGKKEQGKKETRDLIFSGNYVGALKVDGYYERLLKDEDGNCFMIARSKDVNGNPVNKLDWVPQFQHWMADLPNGTCLLAECYLPGQEGSKNITTLLGCGTEKCIQRQNAGKMLNWYIFDVMAYNGVNYDKMPIVERIKELNTLRRTYPHQYIQYAEYVDGELLWKFLQSYLAEGREGIVITRKDCPVYFKRTPARMTIKVKKELRVDIDTFIIGANPPTKEYTGGEIMTWPYFINDRTGEKLPIGNHFKEYNAGESISPVTKNFYFDWPGSLRLGLTDTDGKVYYLGDVSGLTEEVKANWRDYLGKCCQISGMEIWEGHIRHPKFMCWRPDKTPAECEVSQVK